MTDSISSLFSTDSRPTFQSFDTRTSPEDSVETESSPEQNIPTGELFSRLSAENSLWGAMYRSTRRPQGEFDEDFEVTITKIKEDADKLGIEVPSQWIPDFAEVRTEADYWNVMGRVEEKLALEKEVNSLGGGKALAMHLGSYAVDPIAFTVDAALGGSARGALLHRAASGAMRVGAAELGFQAVYAADGEYVDPADVALGFGAAMVIGGGFGAALGRNTVEHEEMVSALKRIRAASDEPVDEVFSDSVGAARSEDFPQLGIDDRIQNISDVRARAAEIDEPAKLKARFDSFANIWGRAKENMAMKKLASDLLHNPILKDRSAVNRLSAEERAEHIVGAFEGARARAVEPAFREWQAEVKGLSGTQRAGTAIFRGGKHIDMREEFNRAVGQYMRNGMEGEAPAAVKKAAQAQREMFEGLGKRAVKAGLIREEQLQRGIYMPRVKSLQKVSDFQQRVGVTRAREVLSQAFAQALKRGREGAGVEVDEVLNGHVGRAMAARFLVNPTKGGFDDVDFKYLDEMDYDYILDLLEDMKRHPDYDADIDEVRKILQKGLETNAVDDPDAGKLGNLKRRLIMDEDTEFSFTDVNGDEVTMRIKDLLEDDIDRLSWGYTRALAGEIALTEKGYSTSAMRTLLREAETEAAQNTAKKGNAFTDKQVKDLDFMYRRVMGMSLDHDFKELAGEDLTRVLRMATGIGYITRMGSGWINAAVEATTILAHNSLGRIWRNMPVMKEIQKEILGKEPLPVIRQLNMLAGGIGQTLGRATHNLRHEADELALRGASPDPVTRMVNRGEDTIEGLKQGASWANMLSYVTDYSRQVSSVMALSTLDDILVHGRKAPKWFAERSRSWALDDHRLKIIGDYLGSDGVKRGKTGEITDLGRMPTEVNDALEDYIFRYTSDSIQHINAGNLPQFMQNPLGRLVLQFRSFVSAAWVRHTLKDIHYGDSLGAMKLLITGTAAAVAYMGRTAAFNYGDESWQDKMGWDDIFKGATQYAVNTSLIPTAMDQISRTTLGEPMFAPRTSGLSQSGLGSVPMWKWVEDVGNLASYGPQTVRSLSQGKGVPEWDRRRMQAVHNVAFIDTIWALRPLTNALEHQFEYRKDDTKVDPWELLGVTEEE